MQRPPEPSYTYDAADRLAGVTDPLGHAWDFTYDPAGNLTRSTAPGGAEVTRSYTARNQLENVVLSGGPTYDLTYTPTGWLSGATDSAGHTWSAAYNPLGWLTSVTDGSDPNAAFTLSYAHDDAGRTTALRASGEASRAYTYDARGDLTQLALPSDPASAHTTFAYDAAREVTGEVLPDGSRTAFGYDGAGRLASVATTTGAGAALAFAYTRDANGNVTAENTARYRYDALSRLTAVLDASGNTTIAAYTYDFENRRTSATDASGTTYFHYDGASPNVVAETDGAGTTIASYAYDAAGRIHSMTRGGATYYYLANGHGDVMALTNASGAIVDSYRYDPWGKVLTATETVPNPYRYAGYRWDGRTGLYYLWNRYYSCASRTLLTPDQAPGDPERPGTQNPYSYCNGNPVNRQDAAGLTWGENWQLFWDWVLQQGEQTRYYGPNDPATQEMRQSWGARQMHNEYKAGCYESGHGSFSSLMAYLESTSNPFNGTQVQVGGYEYSYTNSGDGTVTYTIHNTLSRSSFFYHLYPSSANVPWREGLMGNMDQVLTWTEANP